jgi:glycosyltransferase involved in cell wall biosynthesis
MPLWANKNKIDIFWSPAHRLPIVIRGRIRTVITIHDLIWRHAPETMRKLSQLLDATLMPHAISKADGVIAVSKHTAKDIVSEIPKIKKNKIRIIYEGVSLTKYLTIDHIVSLGIDRPYILFVGTLEPRKNLRRLCLAFKKINSELKNKFKLIIAGGKGWGREDVSLLIRQLKLSENVLLLGYVSEETLATLYKHATLLAMPSLYEGFGLPIIEAMHFGTPVLTSNVSSMKEIAMDAAVLVDPLDVNSISDGLILVLQDFRLQRQLSQNGLKRASEFNWMKAARETLSFFDHIYSSKALIENESINL